MKDTIITVMDWKLAVYTSLISYFVIESYIDWRQYLALNNRTLPSSIRSLFDQKTVDKSSAYEQDSLKLKMCRRFWSFLISGWYIHQNTYRSLWDTSEAILQRFLNVTNASTKQAIVCSTLLSLVNFVALLPFDIVSSFVVEEKYGFNKLTWSKFWSDEMKSFAVSRLMSTMFYTGLIEVIEFGGESFVLYASGFLVLFYVVMFTFVPMVVLPWFYKLSPLEEGELKAAITTLATKEKFPSKDIYLCDGSSRSSHSNAFFMGLPWAKRIVIFDTLVESATVDEIVAVLAHELGHWKNNDMIKQAFMGISETLLSLHVFSLVYRSPDFYAAFGFAGLSPVYIGFVLFEELSKVTELIFKLVQNSITRVIEYNADKFATKRGYKTPMRSSLVKLESDNLSATNIDWLYAVYSLSHPALSERLAAIDVIDKDL